MPAQFTHDSFQYGFATVLGAVYRGAADASEVLATADRIVDGDSDSWLREWTRSAGAAWAAAGVAAEHGHRASARAHYLRAGTYYAAALSQIAHTDGTVEELSLWRRQRACWDHAIGLFDTPGERIQVPYEATTLPGYFFRASDARPGELRPLVVFNNGTEWDTAQPWLRGGAAASERGYHWMTFDGPGQHSALVDQGLRLRPDWEAVLTPVADAMIARPDVDPARIAVIGMSQAGYWVPRALAYEHRFAAAAVDPGIVDLSDSWLGALPDELREQLTRGERANFDRELRLAGLFAPDSTAMLRQRGAALGSPDASPFDTYERALAFRLGDEVSLIKTPMLVADSPGETRWPGQSRALFDRLRGPKRLMRFAPGHGDGPDTAPPAAAAREAELFDWLDGYLAPERIFRARDGR